MMITIVLVVTVGFNYTIYNYYKLFLSALITAYFVIYILSAVTFTTLIKRIKTRTLIKNSITCRVLKIIKIILIRIKNEINKLIDVMSNTWKIVFYSIIYIFTMIIVFAIFNGVERLRIYYRFWNYNICILSSNEKNKWL